MKNDLIAFLIFISLMHFFSGCKKHNLNTGDDVSVTIYNCSEKQTEPYICFDSLLTDCRCPMGTECVWRGTALIKVSFHERGNTHKFTMSLKEFPSLGYPADTLINGYNITFTKLEPYPDIQNHHPKELTAYFNIRP